jgi:fused signal recognition particle receptor
MRTPSFEELQPYLPAAFAIGALLLALGVAVWVGSRRWKTIAAAREPRTAPAAVPVPVPVPPSATSRLRQALSRTREALARSIAGEGREGDGGYLAGIEEALLLADVGVRTTQSLLEQLEREVGRRPGDRVQVLAVMRRVLGEVFARTGAPAIATPSDPPMVTLVTGVNGVGKTTTIGKLAAQHVRAGRQVLLVAGDTFRAAAVEQLERWGARTGAHVVSQRTGADPAAVVVDGLRSAQARGVDVVIIDTAGRLHTKSNLMEELRKVRRVAARECPGAPHETLLVLDATTGQNGLQQARLFKDAVDISGVVLAKMDGTARGGMAVAIAAELDLPIRFLGVGEGVEDLTPFRPEDFIGALLATELSETSLTVGAGAGGTGRRAERSAVPGLPGR